MITHEDLDLITEKEHAAKALVDAEIGVCVAAACLSSSSDQVLKSMESAVKERGLNGRCSVKGVGCLGLCSRGPLVQVRRKDATTLYNDVSPAHAPAIVDHASGETGPVTRLVCPTDTPFFTRQKKIVLENSGQIDPERIEEYIAAGGYRALLDVLHGRKPAELIEEVQKSGLRGRGGAGYPTGLKWSTVAKAPGAKKYVICNADEGDPGAFMDRSVMESDPHRVLEGMAIAAYAIGAQQGYVYVRAEYPLAIRRLKAAIRAAQSAGLIGQNIAGTTHSFSVEVRLGAGAYVCGEETALIASIEGRRGQPRPRPPYPAQEGLWGCPTLINNVETFANIAPIVRNGGAWYAAIGTEKSKGTKVFALAGRVKNTGLIEVPMGMTLREIIFELGGGIPDKKEFKAVQTGGPSGGCIPATFLDMAVDYESLASVGSIMGSGGMIVLDETSSMVEVAKYFMEFSRTESCGKCVPCRVGTVQMHELLTKIQTGGARSSDLGLLRELCDMVKACSLCGLGMSAPNPVLSTLRYFGHEYEELIKEPAHAASGGNGHKAH